MPLEDAWQGKAYDSTVFPQPAEAAWEIIRDFNNYLVWVGGAGKCRIEHGKSGDAVGGDRSFVEWWTSFDCELGRDE
jgi:hypothetical protein